MPCHLALLSLSWRRPAGSYNTQMGLMLNKAEHTSEMFNPKTFKASTVDLTFDCCCEGGSLQDTSSSLHTKGKHGSFHSKNRFIMGSLSINVELLKYKIYYE